MSRMDRYYKRESGISKRTSRNQDLYKSIYEDIEYSNIEGIADIDKSNEVDISKIKDMLKSRENFQSGRELKSFIPKEQGIKYETFERENDRNYDIRDILNQAKSNKEEEKYHNLDEKSLEILRELKNKPKQNKKQSKDLETMIDSITTTSKLNKLSDNELGLDMLTDLKSDDDVNPTVQNILNEKIENIEKTKTNTGLDNSFFTSSMSFTDNDFEQISELKKSVHKNNHMIRFVIILIMILITIAIVILIFNILK